MFSKSKSQKRGDYVSAIDKEDGIIVVKWLDINVVSVAPTCHGVNHFFSEKILSEGKIIIQVSRPSLITEYNRFMGGTDLMDENISRYRISFRRKKWWWPIFTWLLDTSVVNAWSVRRKCRSKPPISQLNYRRQVVLHYLEKYETVSKGSGRPSSSKNSVTLNRVSDDIRYDQVDHLLVSTRDKKKKRCAGEGCSSSIRTMCSKYTVELQLSELQLSGSPIIRIAFDSEKHAQTQTVQLFLVALYSSEADETSLDQIRYEIFSKALTKPTFELASLPPTNAAAAQHILRVYLQIQGWYDRPNDPLSWGWRRTDLGLLPIINTKDPDPPGILNTVSCKCIKSDREVHCRK
ncbi:hypothetical protein JTB14_014227 [Gonioctena quinquepunctata]|nr:hypothetical protein JTB14_014227 [Gonioctena quinquepunctata]